MGAFFDGILNSRNLNSAPIPLWKLELSDAEYNELKRQIKDVARCNQLNFICKECALFYAESWRREYCGGTPSKEMIAEFAGLRNSQSKTMFECAKYALNLLRIPIIQTKNSQYFRTLLLQGGLPMFHILQKDGFSSFKEFLKRLIKTAIRLEVDWENAEFVKNLSFVRYLPPTYQNENIYAVSLQIVRAIVEERDDLLPYKADSGELKALTDSLKKERDRVRKLGVTHPLAINWFLDVQTQGETWTGTFRYSLDSVKTISSDMVERLESDCFQFDLLVSSQYVATYKRVHLDDERAVYKRLGASNKEFEWKDESVIEVKLVCDNGEECTPSVINSYAPNIEVPQLFLKQGDRYVQQKGDISAESIVLHSFGWKVDGIEQERTISLNGEFYQIAEFSDLEANQSLYLTNESGERIELKNATSKYSVVYKTAYLPWLEKSNRCLLTEKPWIMVYDENGDRVFKGFQILYQGRESSEWKKDFPSWPGLVNIKVVFPDGIEEVKPFYFIGDLKFEAIEASATSAVIRCISYWGNVFPVSQENLTYESLYRLSWNVKRTPDNLKYPSTCSFEIHQSGNPILKISIPSPYQGLCLVKGEDELVSENEILSFNEFAEYRILASGKKHRIGIRWNGRKESEIVQDVPEGITPLEHFRDSINRVLDLHGEDWTSSVAITLGEKTYKIRTFTRNLKLDTERNAIGIEDFNGNSANGGDLYACRILGPEENSLPEVVQLERLDCGVFRFPPDSESGGYVVFSAAEEKRRVIPRLYRIDDGNLNSKSFDRVDPIQYWKAKLEKASVSDVPWSKVLQYIEIADRYNLPFGTFDAIAAAVSTPLLMCKWLLKLFLDGKMETLSSAILNIEREFAFAIHWLRPPKDFVEKTEPSVLQEQLKLLLDEFPKLQGELFTGFLEALRNLITLTLDDKLADLLMSFLFGNLKNVKPDYLDKSELAKLKARAVGKNADFCDMPSQIFKLKNRYYDSTVNMEPYQKALIHAPLYVYEYTQGWNEELWGTSKDCMERRRIINFYRLHYKFVYYTVLLKMLQ